MAADPRLARRGLKDGARFTAFESCFETLGSRFGAAGLGFAGPPFGVLIPQYPPCPAEDVGEDRLKTSRRGMEKQGAENSDYCAQHLGGRWLDTALERARSADGGLPARP